MNTPGHSRPDPRGPLSTHHHLDVPLRSPVLRIKPPQSGAPPTGRHYPSQDAHDTPRSRPAEPGDLEKLFPRWLDNDQASGGPNYLGYAALLLPVALLAILALLAMVVTI